VRLFLALVVAVDHLRFLILQPSKLDFPWQLELGMNGGFAVMFFYIISGFLMSMVLTQKYPPTTDGTMSFYKSRFTRIFCLYWPIAAISLLDSSVRSDFLTHSTFDKITAFFPFGLDWIVAFGAWPGYHWDAVMPKLGQAWTLGAELTFYILAPWLLRSRWPVLIAFLLSIATRAWFVHAIGFDERWTYMFAPSTLLFFLLGHFVQSASQRHVWLQRGSIGALLLLVCVISLVIDSYTTWDSFRFWIAALAFALSLPGVFHGTKNARISNGLGELSYPIYLAHILVLLLLARIGWFGWPVRYFDAGSVQAGIAVSVSFFVALIAAGFLVHWLIETPVSKGMRWVLDGTRSRVAVTTVAVSVPAVIPD
jgi:peptidoglycan/LPS O-acetylase OafA/YrhL